MFTSSLFISIVNRLFFPLKNTKYAKNDFASVNNNL